MTTFKLSFKICIKTNIIYDKLDSPYSFTSFFNMVNYNKPSWFQKIFKIM